jgi:hypothetical protein
MKMELIKSLKSKMPMPKGKDEMLDVDSLSLDGEAPEDMEMDAMEAGPLADLSDDELLAEVKKRGLSMDKTKSDDMELEEIEEEDESYS